MSYSIPSVVVPRMVSTIGPWGGWPRMATSACASSAFESANRAIYYPVIIPATCVIRRVWWANGATVSASYNVDVGVYADAGRKPGTKLISAGSTAQGTASEVQFVDVTDTTIAAGLYWLAITCSSVTASFFASSAGMTSDALFRFQEASGLPLPATATPVESSSSNLYCFGFATTASP